MSTQYPGGFITKSPVAPTSTAASGIWTVDQALQYVKAGTWPSPPVFIEDLFSTYLYTGTAAALTINNGINESGKGALTWIKARTYGAGHCLFDTARGTGVRLMTNNTNGNIIDNTTLTAFNSNGFSLGTDSSTNINVVGEKYVAWTFAKQPKFFDIVTYTGNGAARTLAHNLGSVPGCMIVKRTDTTANWATYHRSLNGGSNPQQYVILLNSTGAYSASSGSWNNTAPTSTDFSVGTDAAVNASGGTYVAYLFAHDAGGFPVSGGGSTNGITCGTYAGNGSSAGPIITLGYEPQWVLIKCFTSGATNWILMDNIRGIYTTGAASPFLNPNTFDAEATSTFALPLATGFQIGTSSSLVNSSGQEYIYIAIRRGPMKTPTVGTSVFAPVTYAGTDTVTNVTTNIVPSLTVIKGRGTQDWFWTDMLRGPKLNLRSNTTGAEAFDGTVTPNNTGFTLGVSNGFTNAGVNFISYSFLRAPSFFDEVCYTGNGVAGTIITHNLTVVPELIIVKRKNGVTNWPVYHSSLGPTKYLSLNLITAVDFANFWNNENPTDSRFSTDASSVVNASGGTYVAYLFATCAGVSKVGSYTGTGALQTVNCGFTSGARFVLIKRTDSTGSWFTYDSARGISSGTDPFLYMNSSDAEVTGFNYVDTDTTGFKVTAAAPTSLNAVGGNYIFLAIA